VSGNQHDSTPKPPASEQHHVYGKLNRHECIPKRRIVHGPDQFADQPRNTSNGETLPEGFATGTFQHQFRDLESIQRRMYLTKWMDAANKSAIFMSFENEVRFFVRDHLGGK
jgi:hypothetical protein